MDWLDRMNKAIEYIEDNLTEKSVMKKPQKLHTVQYFIFKGCSVI